MKETWGPPIKTVDGKIATAYEGQPPEGYASNFLHQLTPQYSHRKRRGTTPPPSEQPKKKAKKEHKKFLAPGGVDMVREGTAGSDASGSKLESSPSLGMKKLSLLPPMPDGPNGVTCVRCNGAPLVLNKLLRCPKCARLAYCSMTCKDAMFSSLGSTGKCTNSCGREGNDSDSISSDFLSVPELESDGSSSSSDDSDLDQNDNKRDFGSNRKDGDPASGREDSPDSQQSMPDEREPESDEGAESELANWDIWEYVCCQCPLRSLRASPWRHVNVRLTQYPASSTSGLAGTDVTSSTYLRTCKRKRKNRILAVSCWTRTG